ncbi:MAG TPA: enoyl-CoA hydratase-related protein [Planctomycetota bacterium]|nr:enoyl-CoA hydratase-related protein [Planctomycetota bacterium]
MPEFMRIEQDGPLARVIFTRDKGLNILSTKMLTELKSEWSAIEHSGARVCIFRGDGKAFLAGADIKEMAAMDMQDARNFSALGQSVFEHIECSEVISIAAIHGACLGGGCELALACDIRVGSAGMSIGQPEVNIGLIPGFGGSQRLPRVVGMGWALRMILSGQPLSGEQALHCGLITDTGNPADLAARADALAKVILTRGPEALCLAKKLTRSALCVEQSNGLKAERYAFGNTFESGEAKEGLSAFVEKRTAKFPPPKSE